MMPTFNPQGDVALVEHITTSLELLQPGDVVIATSVQNPRQTVCKRILGLGGDIIQVVQSMDGPNRNGLMRVEKTLVEIPKGHVWLQGDNVMNSTDSRQYGPVPYATIKGRVLCRIWPLWPCWIERKIPET